MDRAPGPSVRVKLALSYAGFLVLAGMLLLAVVWAFLLRYIPSRAGSELGVFYPGQRDLVQAFAPAAAWTLVALLLVGLVGGWLLAGRMLTPLRRITAATRQAATGSLSHRVNMGGRQDEFRELADAFDAMLARLEAHVGEQQRFAANASHELRTPLAITRTLLDVAQSDPERDHAADLARLQETNARAIDLTEALLLLSRAGAAITQVEVVDLSLLAEQAVETLLPLAEERRVTIEVSGTITDATGSPSLLLQLVTNLVHNAIVHNHEGGSILVHTRSTDGNAALIVENTGPTLAPDQVATLTEPFVRGTTRTRSEGHVGLGLSIVERIVGAHHGTVTLRARSGGGLWVSVELPRGHS